MTQQQAALLQRSAGAGQQIPPPASAAPPPFYHVSRPAHGEGVTVETEQRVAPPAVRYIMAGRGIQQVALQATTSIDLSHITELPEEQQVQYAEHLSLIEGPGPSAAGAAAAAAAAAVLSALPSAATGATAPPAAAPTAAAEGANKVNNLITEC